MVSLKVCTLCLMILTPLIVYNPDPRHKTYPIRLQSSFNTNNNKHYEMYNSTPESFYNMLQHSPSLFMSQGMMRPQTSLPPPRPYSRPQTSSKYLPTSSPSPYSRPQTSSSSPLPSPYTSTTLRPQYPSPPTSTPTNIHSSLIKSEISSPSPYSPQVFQFPPMRPINIILEQMSAYPVIPSYPVTSSAYLKPEVRSPTSQYRAHTSSTSPSMGPQHSEMRSQYRPAPLSLPSALPPLSYQSVMTSSSSQSYQNYARAPPSASPYTRYDTTSQFHYPTPPQSPSPDQHMSYQLAKILSSQARYTDLMSLITSSTFPSTSHAEIRELWLNAVYTTAQADKPKKLSSMARHRLRKRFPFPSSITLGEETSYNIKASARKLLVQMFDLNPYPSCSDKKALAVQCGMEYVQVSHWFKNRRMRSKGKGKVEQLADTLTQY